MKTCKSLFVVLLFVVCAFQASTVLAQMVSIAGNDINMRSGPGTRYKILWQLGSGFPLKVLKRKGQWIRVQDFEGTIGWVNRNVVNRVPHMIVKVHRKSRKRINVRRGPGTRSRIVAKAHYGVVFQTLKRKNGWVKVHHRKGVTGWVKRSLLWGY